MDPKELRGLVEAYQQIYAPQEEIEEATYSAKAARAGKDIGKPGKAFAKIAKEAGKRYGSKERGEKVAGAVLAKLRKQHEEVEIDEAVKGADPEMRKAAAAERRAGDKRLSPSKAKGYAAHAMQQAAYVDKKTKGKHIPGYAYAEEVEQVDESDSLAAMQARREKRLAAQRKREGTTAAGKDFGHNYWKTAAQRKADKDTEYKAGMKKEEVDIFDTVLEYLVAEGYADNNQEALKIMANLSEEEILEYRKLAAAAVGGLMALNMMKPGVAPTGIKRQTPEPDKTELVSKADKEKKDAEERRQADLYAQSRVDQARRTGLMK